MASLHWAPLPNLPPLRFFGGKGGVGKTTCAAASALALAEGTETGRRVLIISTDPAHSLGDALGVPLGSEPRRIRTRRGTLLAVELDAASALERWMGTHRQALQTLAERGTYLDGEDVDRLLGLALPGADELFGLLELARLARHAGGTPCDEVVVDAAPTAHILRLLAMPGALRRYAGALDRLQRRHRLLAESFGGGYQPDQTDDLIAGIEREGQTLEDTLRDPERTALIWVTLPESLPTAEAQDAVAALEREGIAVSEIVVNRVTPPEAETCPACRERRRAEQGALAEVREAFPGRPLRLLPAQVKEPRGLPALRRLGTALTAQLSDNVQGGGSSPLGGGGLDQGGGQEGGGLLEGNGRPSSWTTEPAPLLTSPLPQPPPAQGGGTRPPRQTPPAWLDRFAPPGVRLLLFGGKGGVGKTTCAAATALTLAQAQPERRLLLLSTDPAHSLGDALAVPLSDEAQPVPGAPPSLLARELDAARAFIAWRDRYRGTVGKALGSFSSSLGSDPEGEALASDLLDAPPPGLDELVAMSTLLDAVLGEGSDDGHAGARYDLVIVDTAPTGHALRLLEMPALALAWDHALLSVLLKYREAVGLGELAAELVELSRSLKRFQALLADPARTRFVAVTRAAELPRRETVRLLDSLRELSVAVPALVVNALTASSPDCRFCAAAGALQEREVRALGEACALPGGAAECVIIEAPAVYPPPRGVTALAAWARAWKEPSR